MICPKNANKDFDVDNCISCEYYRQCFVHSGFNNYGDNFLKLDRDKLYEIGRDKELNNQKQEMISSILLMGYSATWISIEAIKDYKMRLKYRKAFLKVDGKIPEGEL